MKQLLKVMDLIQRVERFTLEPKYRSSFEWEDENNLIIDCYCWHQASAWKNILDNKAGIVIYIIDNTKIRILNLER